MLDEVHVDCFKGLPSCRPQAVLELLWVRQTLGMCSAKLQCNTVDHRSHGSSCLDQASHIGSRWSAASLGVPITAIMPPDVPLLLLGHAAARPSARAAC